MPGNHELPTVEVGGKAIRVPASTVIHRAVEPFGPAPSELQITQIQRYIAILTLWNEIVSLTSIDDVDELLARQFGEALFAISTLAVEKSRLADVGSGAGFPGLALKVFSPELDVTLIEQNAKKATFLREAVRFLGLERVSIELKDFHSINSGLAGFRWVTAKALGRYTDMLSWARTTLAPDGSVLLWLGSDEATRLRGDRDWIWSSPQPIPNSNRRVLLMGTPQT